MQTPSKTTLAISAASVVAGGVIYKLLANTYKRDASDKRRKAFTGVLLGIGNPLLDISAEVPQSLLDKYEVKTNNAILAGEKHIPIYEEMVKKHKVEFIAGGATQNSIRVAQWMLQEKDATAFIGSVGNEDKYAKQLEQCAKADGVAVHYHKDTSPTGTCACLIVDKERSLIANLSAANNYKLEHLKSPEIDQVLQRAKYYYIAGFFLTVSPPSIMHVAKHANANGKTLCMNLSAPFICHVPDFKKAMLEAMPYVDFIFGNESEAEAFGQANQLEDKSPLGVAKALAALPKINSNRPRTAVITQGPGEVLVVKGGQVHKFSVPKLDKAQIVDSNGAGDAFVGGFLAELIKGKSMKECVAAGSYCARVILQVSGTVLTGSPASPSKYTTA